MLYVHIALFLCGYISHVPVVYIAASTYGKGMYFSRDANSSTAYAASCQGSRHMYLARVLTGEFTTGNYTTSIPPPKNLRNDPNVLFDSVVDDIHNPCVFVVFFADQAYPEYLITYIK